MERRKTSQAAEGNGPKARRRHRHQRELEGSEGVRGGRGLEPEEAGESQEPA